jgi:hypothetical protein
MLRATAAAMASGTKLRRLPSDSSNSALVQHGGDRRPEGRRHAGGGRQLELLSVTICRSTI